MIVYYRKDQVIYRRDTLTDPVYEQVILPAVHPNVILFLDETGSLNQMSESLTGFTSSYAITSSWANSVRGLDVIGSTDNSINSVFSLTSSYASTASYALNVVSAFLTWDQMVGKTWDKLK